MRVTCLGKKRTYTDDTECQTMRNPMRGMSIGKTRSVSTCFTLSEGRAWGFPEQNLFATCLNEVTP